MGACPGNEESAGVNDSHRCPKGNRQMRRGLNIRYEERGPAVSAEAKKVRAPKMIRELRGLGYRIEVISPAPTA
jgi:hypothetical protein